MNTMQLLCFSEVAETLSFSKAAEHLHVSQPTVSHQIKALEDELGCTLLVRSTRSVHLSDEGFTFLGYANNILELDARAKLQLSQGKTHLANQLRIGVTTGLEAQLIASALACLYNEDNTFDPVVRMAPFSALLDMLESGMVDVMIAYRDPAGEPAGATVFRRMFDVQTACVCAPQHPVAVAGFSSISTQDLREMGRIAVASPHVSSAAIARAQRNIGLSLNSDQVVICANLEIALAIATAGIAYTLLPDIPSMHRDDLRFVPVEDVEPITVGVRVRRGRRTALLDRFIAVLETELQTVHEH